MSQLKALNEQVIVITGASSGIGLATAREAAKRGATVVLVSRSEQAMQDQVAKMVHAGGLASFVIADVAERDQLQRVADDTVSRYGRINTWVNNAAVSIYGRLEEVSEADSRRLFDINFWGLVNGSLIALPYLRAQGGALINVGSEVSDAVVPLQGMYTASKHAVKGFTDALRVEVEDVDKAPISITLIQPTAVNTPFPQHAKNYMAQEPKLPTPQIEPEKVAEAILHAAEHATRDTRVGVMAKVNTFLAKNVPGVGDWMASKQVDRQQRDELPRDPEGTLYRPGGTGRTNGEPVTSSEN